VPRRSARASAGAPTASRALGGGERRARLGKEPPPRVGQRHAARRALQESDPELDLEPAQLLADRGLDDVQALGRAPEVQLLGDGHEVVQLAKLHGMITIRDECTSRAPSASRSPA
jgi:hypothetical protein